MTDRTAVLILIGMLLPLLLQPDAPAGPAVIYRDTIRLKQWEYESRLQQFPPGDRYFPYHRLTSWPGSGQEHDYPSVELENDFIKVTVLPHQAGRVLRFINKATGNNQFYLNPMGFKTTPGGRLGWWLVPGGTEWMVPFDEHAPTFYQPFDDYEGPGAEPDGIRIEDFDGGVRLSMAFDEGSWSAELGTPVTRWRTEIQVEVPDAEALYREHIRVVNESTQAHELMFWENAQLCPGPGNMIITPGSERNLNVELVYPGNVFHMYDHNAMEPWLAGPEPWGRFSWPRHSNTANVTPQKWAPYPVVIRSANLNLSLLQRRYEEGINAIGTFIPAGFGATFAGVYNLDSDEGVAKTFPPVIVSTPEPIETGTKMWNFGVYGAVASYNFSDGTNVFIELMGGPCRVFEEWDSPQHPTGEADRIVLGSGQELVWTNAFSSPHGIGGFTHADERAVLNLKAPPAGTVGGAIDLEIGVFTIAPQTGGAVSVDIAGTVIFSATGVNTSPGVTPGPFHFQGPVSIPAGVSAGPRNLQLTYRFPDGATSATSRPITISPAGGFTEGFGTMPPWSDLLVSTTGIPAEWSLSAAGWSGNALAASGLWEGVDNRVLIYPIPPNYEGTLSLRARCPSGTGFRYWARAAYRLASDRDEICGPGMSDPGAGWHDVVAFRWDGVDGNGNQWEPYAAGVHAGPDDRYLAVGFELGSTDSPRPGTGWDEVVLSEGLPGGYFLIR